MGAFNEIEDHFRAVLGAEAHATFATLLQRYSEKKRLPHQQREALTVFASLRNAIAHGRYYGGQPIAEPVEDVVRQIESLRNLLKKPPQALTVVHSGNVCIASPDEQISVVLAKVRMYGFSQFPVYAEDRYFGLLTTNAIARWLAEQFTLQAGLAEDASVRDVLAFSEPHERARLVPRTITAAEAIDQLSVRGEGTASAIALIITHNGKPSDKPLALVVADDMSRLTAALALS